MIAQPEPYALIITVIIALAIGAYSVMARRRGAQWLVIARRAIIGLLIVVTAWGPSVPGALGPSGMLNLDVIYVIDTTASMNAEDYASIRKDAVRFEGAVSDAMALTNAMTGAQFSIITFDSKARREMPLTTDTTAVTTALAGLSLEISVRSHGSSIAVANDMLAAQLKAMKEKNPQRSRLVFYFGDGEQTDGKAPASFAQSWQYTNGGAVLGYGTEKGATMKSTYGYSFYDYATRNTCEDKTPSLCYIDGEYDANGPHKAVSKADPGALTTIASQLGVPYVDRNTGGDVKNLVGKSGAERIAASTREVTSYANLSWIVSIVAGGLVLYELYVMIVRARQVSIAKSKEQKS